MLIVTKEERDLGFVSFVWGPFTVIFSFFLNPTREENELFVPVFGKLLAPPSSFNLPLRLFFISS